MKNFKSILTLIIISLAFASCSNDEVLIPEISGNYNEGIIISAEGNFGNRDGSISYVNENLNRLATNFVYTGVNQTQLGGLIQSIAFSDTYAYIILNDVNTIVVADKITFEKVTEINTGLQNPRYMTFVNDKGYVTNWGDGRNFTDDYLAIVDLTTNTVENTTIALDNGVEQILSNGNKLYISHKGGFSSNNIISVVDLAANNSVEQIIVKDNPDEMYINDSADRLIVLSQGKPLTFGGAPNFAVLTNTPSSISFINLDTNEIQKEISFNENVSASLLSYDNNNIFYYLASENKVYQISEDATSLATEGIDVGNIYGMNVRDNNLFTVSFAFTSLSRLNVFDINSKSSIYASPVGLGGAKIYFND